MPEKIPVGWPRDQLSLYSDSAFSNELATFTTGAQWHHALNEVADLLPACSDAIFTGMRTAEEFTGRLLFLQNNAQYLATARAAASGHCVVTYPIGRALIESAFYGWHLISDPTASIRWENKPNDREELRAWNREFSVGGIARKMKQHSQDAARVAQRGQELYQFAIDQGAHPNVESLFGNMVRQEEAGEIKALFLKVLHQPSRQFSSSAKFAIEAGIFNIMVFGLALPEAEQALQLNAHAERIIGVLNALPNFDGDTSNSDLKTLFVINSATTIK